MELNTQVMVIDDEEGVRQSWQRFLCERGMTVTTAEDGESAISKLSRQPVDVVVSDLRMPGTDGLGVLEWIHERQPKTRFIMFTGYGDHQVERRARKLGAYEYLEKPVSPDTLADVVASALETLPAAAPAEEVAPEPQPQAQPQTAVEVRSATSTVGSRLGVVGVLAAGPILGLAYVIFLPLIGFGSLLWLLAEQVKRVVRPKSA